MEFKAAEFGLAHDLEMKKIRNHDVPVNVA
jgi:hypothetical protein